MASLRSPETDGHHFREPDIDCLLWSQVSHLILATSLPLSQSDPSQLDQGSHAGSQEDGCLITVLGIIVTLYLVHHKLGVAQQGVLCEPVQVNGRRRDRGLWGRGREKKKIRCF